MSSAGEEETRRGGRRGNDARSAGQQRQNPNHRDSQQPNRRGGKTGQNVNRQQDTPSPSLPPQDEHVPLKGFNHSEVDDLLKRGYDAKATIYKPENTQQSDKSQSPWGAKAGSMSNNKDFWLELRKQVTALQQSGGVSQGG